MGSTTTTNRETSSIAELQGDYERIEAHLARARRLRSEAMADYFAEAWSAVEHGVASLIERLHGAPPSSTPRFDSKPSA